MTTRYELIAIEQPGTNVKALHQAYQAFVVKLNDLYDRQVKNGESDWWSHFSDPQVHILDNRIVVFSIMTNVPDEPAQSPLRMASLDEMGFTTSLSDVEPLPFDEPPIPKHGDMKWTPGMSPRVFEHDGVKYNVYWYDKSADSGSPKYKYPHSQWVWEPVEEPTTTSPLSTWSEWVDVPVEELAPVPDTPKRKRGRPRKTE